MDVINDNADGLDGLGQLKALLDAGIQPPIAETMGFALVQVEPGLAVFEGEPGSRAGRRVNHRTGETT